MTGIFLGEKTPPREKQETGGEVGCFSKSKMTGSNLKPNRRRKVFLDVGSHKGETLKIALEKQYNFDKIYCFEPSSECCRYIADNFPLSHVQINKFGLWNSDCMMPLHGAGGQGASVFADKPQRHADITDVCRFVSAAEWFKKYIRPHDLVYLKLNCEGSECVILDNLIASGEYKKINTLMVDFDVRKIPSQKHRMNELKAKLNKLNIPKIYYIDEYNLGKGTHSYFTHFWLDNK